jgi:hypothetical protein
MQDAQDSNQRWLVQIENAVREAVEEPAAQATKEYGACYWVLSDESQGIFNAMQEVLFEEWAQGLVPVHGIGQIGLGRLLN